MNPAYLQAFKLPPPTVHNLGRYSFFIEKAPFFLLNTLISQSAIPDSVTGIAESDTAVSVGVTLISESRSATPFSLSALSEHLTAISFSLSDVSKRLTAPSASLTGVSASVTATPFAPSALPESHTLSIII